MNRWVALLWLPLAWPLSGPLAADEGAWRGRLSTELRAFPKTPSFPEQKRLYPSLAIQPEYYRTWDKGRHSFTFVPFLRLDPIDSERTHADVRELTWLWADGPWEIRAGMREVFWGVTESQHLVNVINQTDAVEDLDGDEKLGQPMINLSYAASLGTLDLFMLPYFRERPFAGWKGRPHAARPIDDDQTRYESPAGRHHIDWAIRWFQTWGVWDIGLSHFVGTNRDPLLLVGRDGAGHQQEGAVLTPYYAQMNQTGLDLQSTQGGWLIKAELISRDTQGERYSAATGGFEYTLVGLLDSDADLGIIGEYLFDDRHDHATTPFASDVMTGLRLTLNDEQSTSLLLGSIIDPDSGAMAWKLEGNRRLGESWKLSVEGRALAHIPVEDPRHASRRDAVLRVELAHYW